MIRLLLHAAYWFARRSEIASVSPEDGLPGFYEWNVREKIETAMNAEMMRLNQ